MYKAISANKRNTVIIMAVFVGLIGAIGWVISQMYNTGSHFALGVIVVAAIYALIQYFIASRLAMAMTGAREISRDEAPEYYRIVENLSIASGLPMPKVTLIDDPAPNAFATGRDPKHAIVGATTGLLNIMDKRELEAVMAHEMSHVQNYDIRVSMIAFGLVSAIGILADLSLNMIFYRDDRSSNPIIFIIGIVFILLTPLISSIIQMAISRQREYLADASGALLTRDSEGMASALSKLQSYGQPMKRQSTTTSNLFLSNPLSASSLSKLFSSHPPLEERIARLRGNADRF
ncbi:protease [Candidatus Saccharibacteria bacterium]|nr:protease [Candidatus Saccharibacteria bacterium]